MCWVYASRRYSESLCQFNPLFARLHFRKVGGCACPYFCLLVIRGGGCTALPTLHIWPEPRPWALSQHIPDLLLWWPGAGTARLASQLGKGSQAVTSSRKSSRCFSVETRGWSAATLAMKSCFLGMCWSPQGSGGCWYLFQCIITLKSDLKKSRISWNIF